MATRTFSGTGNWSTAGNWDTPPVAGDTIIIAAGADCTYDDTSGSAWGPWTVNGTVRASTTAGTYTLKMGGTIAIATTGSWLVGSSGTPYPDDCLFVVDHNGGYGITITGSAVYAEYAAAITRDYTTLTGAESAGATRLEVDHDLTGDKWNLAVMAGTAEIGIANVNKGQNYELRVISAITATYIDITAGLTASKIAGTIISAVTRNVRHIGYTGTTGCVSGGTGAIIRAEYKAGSTSAYLIGTGTSYQINAALHGGAARSINSGTGHTISGGSITGNNWGFIYGSGHTISGGSISGNNVGLNTSACCTISGGSIAGNSYGTYFCACCTISGGSITGNIYGIYLGHDYAISGGSITGNTNGIYYGIGHTISGGSITGNNWGIQASKVTICGSATINNTNDLRASAEGRTTGESFGIALAGTTQYLDYSSASYPDTSGISQFVAWDIAGVSEALKAWMYGGNVSSSASKPTGWSAGVSYAQYWLATYEKAACPVHIGQRIQARSGVPITVTMHCIKGQTGMVETPRVQIIDPNVAVFTSGSILAETVMADDLNFQTLVVRYTPSRTGDLLVRVRGTNASGTLYWRTDIKHSPNLLHIGMSGGL